jgi:4-amino-4-deoxy-L-arabinose transferase-like glycosyltransferase
VAARGAAAPSAPGGRPGRWLLYAAAILAIVGWTLASRAAFGVLPLGPDQGLYITIGEEIKHGRVPWRDAWDNKPPGTYYLYAAALTLGPDYSQQCTLAGPLIPSEGFLIRCAQFTLTAVDVLWTLAIVAATWWIGARLFGGAAGALAGLLCAFFVSMASVAHGGNTPDDLALLPSTLAVAATLGYADSGRRSALVLAGVLGAAAVLFKQTAIVVLLGLAVWALRSSRQPSGLPRSGGLRSSRQASGLSRGEGLLGPRRWRDLPALALGALLVFGGAAAVFGRLGVLGDLVEQTLIWNGRYVAAPGLAQIPLQAARQSFRVFTDSQGGLWLAALGGLPLVPRAVRGDRRLALLLIWVVASGLGLALGGARFFAYYYVAIVPPLAVCGAFGLAALWRGSHAAGRAWLAVAGTALVVFCGQLQAHVFQRAWYERLVSTVWTPEEFVGGSIRGDPGTLFVWGNGSQVYAISGVRPASRYLHTLALSSDFGVTAQVAEHRRELMASLEAAPPDHIALDTPWLTTNGTQPFPELRALLERDYTLANDPKNPTMAGWELYRLESPR